MAWQTGSSIRMTTLAYNGNKMNGLPEDQPNFNQKGYSISDLFDCSNTDLFLNAIAIRLGSKGLSVANFREDIAVRYITSINISNMKIDAKLGKISLNRTVDTHVLPKLSVNGIRYEKFSE